MTIVHLIPEGETAEHDQAEDCTCSPDITELANGDKIIDHGSYIPPYLGSVAYEQPVLQSLQTDHGHS